MSMFCQNCQTLGLTRLIHRHTWPTQETQETQAVGEMFSVAEPNPNEDASWRDKPLTEEESGWCDVTISMYLRRGSIKNIIFIFNF